MFHFPYSDFGHRPRRVYVIINPTCGSSSGWNTWIKVEPFFVLAHVHTEVIGKLISWAEYLISMSQIGSKMVSVC